MLPLTETQIRSSFVNCTQGEVKRITVPRDLADQRWDDLDFFGWNDPTYAGRAYLVAPGSDDQLIGVALRYETGGTRKAQMCKICLTTHPSGGVSLMTARKPGAAGRNGNTVGTYICTDLDCSLYARGEKTPALGRQYREDLDVGSKIDRVRANVAAFLARVSD
ncbi:FBP domain-containing protein [Williamsia sp. CHRR-6]|uniref:FBP domain-containing protein n=1 Tax=Williamsia sp. CHRR-6 TaxID=2835871 RepID=UPI001BDB6500|nr:FBP domain-containing protein [Williamsia sp. CHRR-6]MBT0566902.1 FBP domain-containing protein [Williamsia sp. CHRR-6]